MTDASKSSRREFLKGKAAAQALVDAASQIGGAGSPLPEPAAEGYLLRLSRRAMACQFEILFNAGQHDRDAEAGCAALDLVDQLEAELSIYRDSSEVSLVNRLAVDEPVPVEGQLFALLTKAVELSRQTDGAFDITTGPLVRAWGFVRRSGALPTDDAIATARALVGSDGILLDAEQQSVRFARPGMEINLGAIGKGYALDRVAEVLLAAGVEDFALHGGNSSVLARGACIEPGHDSAWTIGIRNPHRVEQRIGQLRLKDRALATSGSGTQFFTHAGQRYGHLLDPRTGWPASGVLSATAIAPTAAEADALSTAFYVLGLERAAAFCAAHPDCGCILLCPGARHAEVDIHPLGAAIADFVSL